MNFTEDPSLESHNNDADQNSDISYSSSDDNSESDDCFRKGLRIRPWNQEKLNDVRNIELPKDASKYLASSVKVDGLVTKNTFSTYYRNQEKNFLVFF